MTDTTDAIGELASLETWLRPLIAAVPAGELRTRLPGLGDFSLVEHVWHLRDLDVEAFAERLRRTLSEDRPALPDFDGARAAAERGYTTRPLETAVEELLDARAHAVAALRELDTTALTREAELEGVGRLTLAALIGRWRDHDAGHRDEMQRLADALRARY
jgi:hypothetical protein